MSKRWKFRVLNTETYIDSLARTAGSRQDFSIKKHEPDDGHISYWLSSPWLDGAADIQDLSDRLLALKCLIDGAIYLDAPTPIRFDSIWGDASSVSPHGEREVFGGLLLEGAFDQDTDKRTLLPEPLLASGLAALTSGTPSSCPRKTMVLDAEFVGLILFLARHDEVVRGCLLCLGYSGVNFVSLYQCRDFMKADVTCRDAALNASGVSEADMKRFDHTANTFEATGPAGRHGELGHAAPKKPMRESELRTLILPVVRGFLLERRKAMDLEQHWAALPE